MPEFIKNLMLKTFEKPEKIFVFLSLLFGIIYIILSPPFQLADEENHFYRSYQIANGNFVAQVKDNRVGGEVPKSVNDIALRCNRMVFNVNLQINKTELIDSLSQSLNREQTVFVDFPNTANYSPVTYIPQVLAIFIFKLFNASPLILMYFARLFALLFWTILTYFSIKIIPFKKQLWLFISLLPEVMYFHAAVSGDVVNNSVAILLISLILNLAYTDRKINYKILGILLLLTLTLALSKIVYTSTILIFLIIPSQKFVNIKNKILTFAGIIIIAGISVLLWSSVIENQYTSYFTYNPFYRENITLGYLADIKQQTDFMLNNKTETIKIFLKSFADNSWNIIRNYISDFAYSQITLPLILIYTILLWIIFNLAAKTDDNIKLKKTDRFLFLITAIGIIFSVMLTQYLSWDEVGSKTIYPYQGRYFFPVIPLILISLIINKIKISDKIIKITNLVFIILNLTIFAKFLESRYFHSYKYTKDYEIFCDAENIDSTTNMLKTNLDGFELSGLECLNSEKSKSENHSLKLNTQKQFGFTYTFGEIKKGDKIFIEVWQLGNNGLLTLDANEFQIYVNKSRFYRIDSLGWNMLNLEFVSPCDIPKDKLKTYIWYTASDSIYLDNLKIIKYSGSL